MFNKIKIGNSPLTNTIQLYRMGKDPQAALESRDITKDAVAAVVENLLKRPNNEAVLTATHEKHGKCKFIVSVRIQGCPNEGTLISGTQRPQDMLPAFWKELHRLDPCLAHESIQEHFHDEGKPLCDLITAAANDKWPEDDDPVWDMHEVFEYINGVIIDLLDVEGQREGYYFGATEGDGSDYGFWSAAEAEDALLRR